MFSGVTESEPAAHNLTEVNQENKVYLHEEGN